MVIMKTVAITDFKAHCLQLIDEISKTGDSIRITKRGKAIATVTPAHEEWDDYKPGRFAGSVEIVGDIVAPLDVEWEALK